MNHPNNFTTATNTPNEFMADTNLVNLSIGFKVELMKLLNSSSKTAFNLTRAFLEANHTDLDFTHVDACSRDVPQSYRLMKKLPTGILILYVFLFLSTLFTITVYIEEVVFIYKNFVGKPRKHKTIWLLATFPIYSTTALLGVLVPRSGPLVDMVANAFFGTCLYSFGQLMVSYMGGSERMWSTIESSPSPSPSNQIYSPPVSESSPPPHSSGPASPPHRVMRLNTPPICCCCVCLPTVKFNRGTYVCLSVAVMQVCFVRPFIMFLAAVMWADGIYVPGDTSMDNGFIYVAITNLISTMTAVYGLMLTRGALMQDLQERYSISGKIACLQLCLLTGIIPNLIISIMVTNGAIECTPILTSKGRGEILYHIFLVFLMVPLQMMARFFYRRPQDIKGYARKDTPVTDYPLKPPQSILNEEKQDGGCDEVLPLKSDHSEVIPSQSVV